MNLLNSKNYLPGGASKGNKGADWSRFFVICLFSVLITSSLVFVVTFAANNYSDEADFMIGGSLTPSASPASTMHSLLEISSKDTGDTFSRTTDSLEAIRDKIDTLAPSTTALSNAVWTDIRAGYLDYLNSDLKYLVSTALSSPTSGSIGDKITETLTDTADLQPKFGDASEYTYVSGATLFKALKDIRDTLSGTLTLSGGITAGGIISGDGSGLTNVDLLNTAQTLSANKTMGSLANLYFAGGTDYYVNNSGGARFNGADIVGNLSVGGGYSGVAGGGVTIYDNGDIKLDGNIYQSGDVYTVDTLQYTGHLNVADTLKIGYSEDESDTVSYLLIDDDGKIKHDNTIEMQIDANNDGLEYFKVLNGTSGTAMSISEGGTMTLGANLVLAGNQIKDSSETTRLELGSTNTLTGNLTVTGGAITSSVADGGTAIGFTLTTPAYSTSGAKLLSIKNNDTEKLSLDKDGNLSVDKLTVNTIDPVYLIDGQKYATYVADISGGVKTETTGKIEVNIPAKNGNYRVVLNLARQPEGSDLWLFEKTADFGHKMEDLIVILTPQNKEKVDAWYELNAANGQLIIYADKPCSVSYRLSAPRLDHEEWDNYNHNEGVKGVDVSLYNK